MRCFYCGRSGLPASNEHVPSAFLGSRLKTRKVCDECNSRAEEEIDGPFAVATMVRIPRALANVRNVRKQGKEPTVEIDGRISATGEAVRVEFSPSGREVKRLDGQVVAEVVEVQYALDSDLWVRFIAKVALGCAAQICDEDWLDEPIAVALRSLLWHGPIDPDVWPNGIPGWPEELPPDHPVRQALGPDRHVIALCRDDENPGSSIAIAALFGGEILCRLPLPDVAVDESGPAWMIDWHPGPPPSKQDFDALIEQLLREKGWTENEIAAARDQP